MRVFFFLIVLFASLQAIPNDSTQIILNKKKFTVTDTIEFTYTSPSEFTTATLNVWIEHLETGMVWKYRYPVLNNKIEAALTISDSIKTGKYAINFILQPELFKIDGMLKNNFGYPKLNYLLLTKSKESFLNTVPVLDNGAFNIQNIVFSDEAYFIFSPARKKKTNDLFIKLITPLDSIFNPVSISTKLVDIVLPDASDFPDKNYQFNFQKLYKHTTLPEVIVEYKGNTKLQQYDEEYSTSLFKRATKIFDGLDDNAIANSNSVEQFLVSRVSGLRMENNRLVWRNQPVNIFLDEYVLNSWEEIYVNTMDIAMIKIYEPGSGGNPSSNQRGTVSIYTKRGHYENVSQRYKFKLNGYTPIETVWR